MSSLGNNIFGAIGEGTAASLLPNGQWVGSLSEISETSGFCQLWGNFGGSFWFILGSFQDHFRIILGSF